MKLLIMAIAGLVLTGCATTKVVGFDNDRGTVSVQANKSAGQEGAQDEANEYCGHKARLVSMDTKNVGGVVSSRGYISNIENNVYTFACR